MQIKLLAACRDKQILAIFTTIIPTIDDRITVQAAELDHVLYTAALTKPDVLLLEDIEGEEECVWNVLAQIKRAAPSTRVLVVRDACTPLMIIRFIQLGASGCLLKSSDPRLCAKAVAAVHQGESWFGRGALWEALRSQMAAEPIVTSELLNESEILTPREKEIFTLLGRALSNKEIARKLSISDQTVKTHLHHIYVKLHKSGRYKVFLSNSLQAGNALGSAAETRFQ